MLAELRRKGDFQENRHLLSSHPGAPGMFTWWEGRARRGRDSSHEHLGAHVTLLSSPSLLPEQEQSGLFLL